MSERSTAELRPAPREDWDVRRQYAGRDAEGVLLVDYLHKGHTVTGAYYAVLRRQLREEIKQIRRGKLTRGVLFHQDNAPARPHWPWMLSRNVDSILLKTHPILMIWLPLTTTSSRK